MRAKGAATSAQPFNRSRDIALIDGSRPHGSLWIRCHSGSGRKKLFEFPPEAWWLHPTSDVAIAPLAIPLEDFGLRYIPTTLFATEDWLREQDVGLGDRVVAIGLFAQYFGRTRDAPLARFGRIALVPREPLRVPAHGPIPAMEFPALLAELAAWPGQSGSPVFVYFGLDRDMFAGPGPSRPIPNPRLLGIVHGHYNFAAEVVGRAAGQLEASVSLNSGVAIVVPAAAIVELLQSHDAAVNREEFKRVLREEGLIE